MNLHDQHNIKKIGIVRALKLGDLMVAVPAVRALRQYFPKAQISLISLPWAKDFVSRFKRYFDLHFDFPSLFKIPQIEINKEKGSQDIEKIRQNKFDLILQMHGSGKISNLAVLQMRPKIAAGFHTQNNANFNGGLFFPYPKDLNEIRKNLKLLELLGIKLSGENLEFPFTVNDFIELKKINDVYPLAKNYICIHPGAQVAQRRWDPRNFAAVGTFLAEKDFQIILTGVENEKRITADVKRFMPFPVLDLAGKTSLGGIGLIIKKAKLLIANDTGVVHIAAALKRPSISMSFLKNPQSWAPLDTKIHCVLDGRRTDKGQVLKNVNKLLS